MPLKKAIDAFLDQYKLRDKFDESFFKIHWEKIMGSPIAKRTEDISIKNGILYLSINSAPLRNELLMNKSHIKAMLNIEIEKDLIKDIVFL